MKLQEVNSKEVAFVFGRFNPPTIGHGKLLDTLASNSNYKIFASQTQDSKKNPLDYKTKLNFLSQQFPEHGKAIVKDPSIKTIIDVMKSLQNEGYTDVTMVAGSDRAKSFETLLKKYNNKEYKFDSINVQSAGQRDPDADGVAGASASMARELASKNDFNSFKKIVAGGDKTKEILFRSVRQGMNIKENKPTVKRPSKPIKELNDFDNRYVIQQVKDMQGTLDVIKMKFGDGRAVPKNILDNLTQLEADINNIKNNLLKKSEAAGVGIITKQNTTKDVKPGEIKRQLKKFKLYKL